jgi:hypothetical protein
MAASQTLAPRMTRAQMDALVEGHYRAEEEGDLDAIVEGFTAEAEHDVAGRPRRTAPRTRPDRGLL